VDGGSSYLSHSAGPIHFGAPAASASIDSLVVSFTNQSSQTFTGLNWNRLMGIRPDGSWYLIDHERVIQCGTAAAEPLVEPSWQTDATGKELLLLERTETLLYPQLEEQLVELSVGDLYQGVARTQDAILVDTVAGDGPCPGLRPVRLKVLQATTEPVVYPNPLISDHINLQLPKGGGLLKAELLTSAGAIIFSRTESLPADRRTVAYTIPSLPRGAYILRLDFSGKVTHHNLLRP
jgi:hypothetical protein